MENLKYLSEFWNYFFLSFPEHFVNLPNSVWICESSWLTLHNVFWGEGQTHYFFTPIPATALFYHFFFLWWSHWGVIPITSFVKVYWLRWKKSMDAERGFLADFYEPEESHSCQLWHLKACVLCSQVDFCCDLCVWEEIYPSYEETQVRWLGTKYIWLCSKITPSIQGHRCSPPSAVRMQLLCFFILRTVNYYQLL